MRELDLLIDAARDAGEIAKRFFNSDPKTWDKDGGAGPVTEADLAVNDMLVARLKTARPDYGWLSEESEDNTERLAKDRVFVVDPIDGTRAFIDGARAWSHSIAIVEHGIPTSAVVYLPVMDKLYTASIENGAYLNGERLCVSAKSELQDATVLANKNNFDPRRWKAPPPVKQQFRSSLAYRICLVAEGRFDAMLTLRPTWEWDIAAGLLILQEAGGLALDRIGARPVLNNPTPQIDGLLAANPTLVRGLQAQLA